MALEIYSKSEMPTLGKRVERQGATISAVGVAVLLVLLVLGTVAMERDRAGAGSTTEDVVPLMGP